MGHPPQVFLLSWAGTVGLLKLFLMGFVQNFCSFRRYTVETGREDAIDRKDGRQRERMAALLNPQRNEDMVCALPHRSTRITPRVLSIFRCQRCFVMSLWLVLEPRLVKVLLMKYYIVLLHWSWQDFKEAGKQSINVSWPIASEVYSEAWRERKSWGTC